MEIFMIDVSPNTGRYRVQVYNDLYDYWATAAILPDAKGETFADKYGLSRAFSAPSQFWIAEGRA